MRTDALLEGVRGKSRVREAELIGYGGAAYFWIAAAISWASALI